MTLAEYDAHRAIELSERRERRTRLESELRAAESQLIKAACYWVESDGGGLELVESTATKVIILRRELKI